MKVLILPVSLFLTLTIYSQDYSIQLHHSNMDIEVGYPAILSAGERYPSLMGHFSTEGEFYCEIVNTENDSIYKIYPSTMFSPGDILIFEFNDYVYDTGIYIIDIQLKLSEKVLYETFYFSVLNLREIPRWSTVIVHYNEHQKLRYIPDFRGNRIPDFSTAGYKGGGVSLPFAPERVTLLPQPGDDTERIQEAIDYVSSLPPDNSGIRGAVLLSRGIYQIESSLKITVGGVVLRGEGSGDIKKTFLDPEKGHSLNGFISSLGSINFTLIIATGSSMRSLTDIEGNGNIIIDDNTVSEIIDSYVPVGAKSFRVDNPEYFRVNDRIIVQRTGNSEWISAIGMDQIPQSPAEGSIPPVPWSPFNLNFETTITSIVGDRIEIESSIFNAIEKEWGGGRIFKFSDSERISNVGIEGLRAISFWTPDINGIDNTRHADRFLNFRNIKNGWVQNVAMEHFYASGGAIYISRSARQITIRSSSNLIAGSKYYSGPAYRRERTNIETGVEVGRYGFYIEGQANLVVGCYTVNNRRSFGVGSRVAGPNVFLDCHTENSLTTSEPHHRWSVGGLYDNVADNISIINRLYHGTGQGWAGANYVTWNTRGRISIESPPTAQNWSIGHKGRPLNRQFEDFIFDDGYFDMFNANVLPRSLYIQQLKDRKGDQADLDMFNMFILKEKPDDDKVWNYPNPADYFTIFVYSLEKKSRVLLSVYSSQGEKLSMADFGLQEAGYYESIWETTDDMGRPLPNGMYIYRLTVDESSYSNRLLISK